MVKVGDQIVWVGEGVMFNTLSPTLALKDKTWKARTWRGWHMGYVVDVDLLTGEITTCQALDMKSGICAITYATEADMGNCKVYHWLDEPDSKMIADYAAATYGLPYNPWAYPITIICYLLNWQIDIIQRAKTCWQNLSQFDIYMGKPLQPFDEMPMVSDIMNALEGK
jgi:hypothetical protein